MITYSPEQLADVVTAFDKYLTGSKRDPKASAVIAVVCPQPTFTPTVAVLAFYDGNEDEGRRCFQSFFDINPIADATAVRSY